MTSLLLDTHILLWFLENNSTLKPSTREHIEQASRIVVSAVSIVEISIKSSLGKLQVPEYYLDVMRTKGFEELPVTVSHAAKVATISGPHKDPFDRLLIAQALCENLTIVTRDAHILHYPVKTLAA